MTQDLNSIRNKLVDAVRDGLVRLPSGHTLLTVRQTYSHDECQAMLDAISEPPSDKIEASKGNTPSLPIDAPQPVLSGPERILSDAIRAIVESTTPKAQALDVAAVQSLIDASIDKIELPTRTIVLSNDKKATVDVGVQHADFEKILDLVQAAPIKNVWISGPPGSGKTHLVKAISAALGLEYYSHGACIMPHELSGYVNNGVYQETQFYKAYKLGGVVNLDECDASSERALLVLQEALANGSAVFGGERIKRHPDCIVIAGANTWGHGATIQYTGRAKLDAAFLDRFSFKHFLDYDEKLETHLAGGETDWTKAVQSARKLASKGGVRAIISPRATIAGAALFAKNWKMKDIAMATFGAGMDAETLTKLGF
jgi:hypothetical protein